MWTDKANQTNISTTYIFIYEEWKMTALSPYCEKHEGITIEKDLAEFVEGVIVKHGQVGRVTAVVTDCEPSMVKATRLF